MVAATSGVQMMYISQIIAPALVLEIYVITHA